MSRLLRIVRTFISLPAGIARMNLGKFTLYTVLGCLPWTFALAGIGYALGENWTKAENSLKPIAWLVVGLIAVGILVWTARVDAGPRRICGARSTEGPGRSVVKISP